VATDQIVIHRDGGFRMKFLIAVCLMTIAADAARRLHHRGIASPEFEKTSPQ